MFYRRPINGKVTRDRSFFVQPQIKTINQLTRDLIFGYQFRQGYSIFTDVSGRGNTASIASGTPGLVNEGILDSQSLSGLGTGGLSVPDSGDTKIAGTDHTIATLFKYSYTGTPFNVNFLCARERYMTGQAEFSCHILRNDTPGAGYKIIINYYNSSSGSYPEGTMTVESLLSSFNTNNWHLLVFSYNNSTRALSIYLNNNNINNFTLPAAPFARSQPLYIGIRDDGRGAGVETFTGYLNIQFLYKWNKILSSENRDYLWNNGNFIFLAK